MNALRLKLAMNAKAVRFLTKADPRLAPLIAKIGPITLKPSLSQTPFEALLESIIYQQLNGKAAATIFARMKALFPKKVLRPTDVLEMSEDRLRGAGISFAKIRAIKDLSQKTLEKIIPHRKKIESLSDDEIVEKLCQVKGIGRWTAEMLLIFKLGRPDVLPATDYAIRKAFSQIYRKKALASPQDILKFGEIWRPHRTTASWYLWRSLDS